MSVSKRINKYISDTGHCSRREADKLVAAGLVLVNDVTAVMGTQVSPEDEVFVKNKKISENSKKVTIAFNKPVGVTSTTDQKDVTNIIKYIGYKERIFPIGRLDKMSEGLIFLTNDGDLVNKILRAGNNHEKEYVVTVNKPINDQFIKKMGHGVRILKTVTKHCRVECLGKYRFKIILTQGLNRQIRRMCEKLGYEVTKLKRVRIMNVELKGIERGKWRYLTASEMKQINSMVKSSSKTEEASREHGRKRRRR